jgi:hypothetical protein
MLCTVLCRNFHGSGRQCLEVPNFMGFLSNTESDKAANVTNEVSKKQVLADDDEDDDMEEMFIMVCERRDQEEKSLEAQNTYFLPSSTLYEFRCVLHHSSFLGLLLFSYSCLYC